jgi:hypothetical protein
MRTTAASARTRTATWPPRPVLARTRALRTRAAHASRTRVLVVRSWHARGAQCDGCCSLPAAGRASAERAAARLRTQRAARGMLIPRACTCRQICFGLLTATRVRHTTSSRRPNSHRRKRCTAPTASDACDVRRAAPHAALPRVRALHLASSRRVAARGLLLACTLSGCAAGTPRPHVPRPSAPSPKRRRSLGGGAAQHYDGPLRCLTSRAVCACQVFKKHPMAECSPPPAMVTELGLQPTYPVHLGTVLSRCPHYSPSMRAKWGLPKQGDEPEACCVVL